MFASVRDDAIAKVKRLAADKYGGDSRAMFDGYDSDRDGGLTCRELVNLLYDAEVGSRFTRWGYASVVVNSLDKDGDGKVSWDEFAANLT